MLTKKVSEYIEEEHLFTKDDDILLALSGGCDSAALFHILKTLKYKFSVAHCNFKLRGKDSDKDEEFVKELAKHNNIKIYTASFDTEEFARKNKLSVEDAARKLRYNWFEELRINRKFSCIATAHHLNDRIETFFINFTKGTGIKGMRSILPKNNNIVRPLLFAPKNEIKSFCAEKKIKYRTDKSNFDNYFLRNNLRNNILPAFKKINPKFEETMSKNFSILTDIEKIYLAYINLKKSEILNIKNKLIFIDTEKLLQTDAPNTVLFEIIRPYGFNSSQSSHIILNINTIQTGKLFYSDTHRLLKDRKYLIMEKTEEDDFKSFQISDLQHNNEYSPKFSLKIIKKTENINLKANNSTVFFDADKVKFPLTVRKARNADFFVPFGMKGKKLLSDFFTDLKINLFEREKVLLLVTSKNEIIWVIGYRADNRFKVTDKTKKILKIERL